MDFEKNKELILEEIDNALSNVKQEDIDSFIKLLDKSEKIFFIGVGRVMLSLEAFAKRLSHLGYNCHVVGDITEPAITNKDLLIVGSGSGNSIVPVGIAKKAKSLGATIVHIGSNTNGEIKEITDLMIRIPVRTKFYLEDEIESKQPMTSLFEQSLFIFGDIVCKSIIDSKNIDIKLLWEHHANLE